MAKKEKSTIGYILESAELLLKRIENIEKRILTHKKT